MGTVLGGAVVVSAASGTGVTSAAFATETAASVIARMIATRDILQSSIPVSYTHLTLPTNREV